MSEGEEIILLLLQEELLRRISHKLDVLRAEELSLKEEMALNEQLGQEVSSIVKAHPEAKPSEVLKFKLHVEEIDRITNLLLGLSGRLARTENALNSMPVTSNREKVCPGFFVHRLQPL